MSRTSTFTFVISGLVTLLSWTATPAQPPTLDTGKWREDLSFMAREMESTHKNLFHTMSRQQFETAVKKLHDRMPTLQPHQIVVEMMRIVAMVGDGHSNIYPTRDPKIGFRSLPVQLYLFSDGMFIRAARKEHSSLVGARVVRIGPATVDEAVARVGPLVGRDSEMGIKFFAPYLLTMPEVLHATGLSESMENIELTVAQGPQTKTIILKPQGPVEILPADTDISWMARDGWMDMRDDASAPTPLWLRDPKNLFWQEYFADSKTLYAQINQVGNKPDQTLADFSRRLTSFIDSNPVERLILDVRLNRGGNGTLLKPLELALIKSKIDQPGKLFILMGRSTWSASQFFLNWMEKHSNAVFIGEPSGSRGNVFGDSRRITLPNSGITVRVSVYYWQDWEPWDTRLYFGPNVAAEMSSQDYRSNHDPALAAALQYSPKPPLSSLFDQALAAGGIKLALSTYREFRADRQNKYADTEPALLLAGQRLLGEKKAADALELFKINLAENPHSYRAHFAVGVAYAESGSMDLAATSLKKALDLNPKAYDAASYLRRIGR